MTGGLAVPLGKGPLCSSPRGHMALRKAGRSLSLFEDPQKQASNGEFKCISLIWTWAPEAWASVGSGRGREGSRHR